MFWSDNHSPYEMLLLSCASEHARHDIGTMWDPVAYCVAAFSERMFTQRIRCHCELKAHRLLRHG